jgi:hypothetical protein
VRSLRLIREERARAHGLGAGGTSTWRRVGVPLVLGLGLVLWPIASWIEAASLTLSWSEPDADDVILVERGSTATGPFAQIGQTTPGGMSWVDSTVSAGQAYCYRVRAQNSVGVSAYSNAACGTAPALPPPPPAVVAFVQGAFATATSARSTMTVKFPSGQKAGNLNVVIIGWNDTVASVSDSAGNVYQRAVGPTRSWRSVSQSIYYAKSVVGGASTVTVRFSRSAASADVRVLEYQGLDAVSPLSTTAIGAGRGTTSSTSSVSTSAPTSLLVVGTVATTSTASSGAGYTTRMITTPDGDLAADRIVSAGQYTASAQLQSSGNWVIQLAAFKGK